MNNSEVCPLANLKVNILKISPSFCQFITILHRFRVLPLHTEAILRIINYDATDYCPLANCISYNESLARKSLAQLAPRPANDKSNRYLDF